MSYNIPSSLTVQDSLTLTYSSLIPVIVGEGLEAMGSRAGCRWRRCQRINVSEPRAGLHLWTTSAPIYGLGRERGVGCVSDNELHRLGGGFLWPSIRAAAALQCDRNRPGGEISYPTQRRTGNWLRSITPCGWRVRAGSFRSITVSRVLDKQRSHHAEKRGRLQHGNRRMPDEYDARRPTRRMGSKDIARRCRPAD